MMKKLLCRFLWITGLASGGLVLTNHVLANDVEPAYTTHPFTIDNVGEKILTADFDGDGLLDLLVSDAFFLNIYLQRPEAGDFDFTQADHRLKLPGQSAGWTLDRLTLSGGHSSGHSSGNKGKARIVALVDGNRVLAWEWDKDKLSDPDTLLDNLNGLLPAGAWPMEFLADINRDGYRDLLIPGDGQLHLFFHNAASGYREPVTVSTRIFIASRLRPWRDNLQAQPVGQSIRIPNVNVRDINGDGRDDLVTISEDSLEAFIADSNGKFSARPSYRLDRQAIRERLGEPDVENMDYANLTGVLAYTYDFQLEDIDNDNIDDLLLREGGRISFFKGEPDGMNMERPRQILKSAGNVMSAMLRDENEDGLKDLWLTRVENVSIGNLFVWLAVSGSVDVETFIYRNRGEQFASRPHRKLTVTMKFPSLLRSINIVADAMESPEDIEVTRSVRASLSNPAINDNDLVLLEAKSLAAFLNAVPNARPPDQFLGLEDYNRQRDKYTIDLGELLRNPGSGANTDLKYIAGRQADFHIDFEGKDFEDKSFDENDTDSEQLLDPKIADVKAADMNGDGVSDFMIFTQRDSDSVSGLLLLSR